MGGTPVGGTVRVDARTSVLPGPVDLGAELQRIADRVRDTSVARAVLISSAVGDRLEVVAVAGAVNGGRDALGDTWQRADLDRCLEEAQQHGRLHFTRRRSRTYLELQNGETSGVLGDSGTLLAPLRTADGVLVGVVAADGPVDPAVLGPGACELLEVYAGQARLVLHHLRERDRLDERFRMSELIQSVLQRAAAEADVPAVLDSLAESLIDLVGARGSWVCVESAAGGHADAASYPREVAGRLGPDICAVVEPVVEICRQGDRLLADPDDDTLASLAALAGHDRALLAAVGSGTTAARGALLVFRDADDQPWSDDEREALLTLGHRLGPVVRGVAARDREGRVVEELRELDRYKRDLVASISHDLKTPLTSIELNAELLEEEGLASASGGERVAAIRRSAQRLDRLVDDLLALARAEETTPGVAPETDVVELVREAWQHVEDEAQQRGVHLHADLPETLPLAVDADALRRVFVQLVSNAVKFSLPAGQVRLVLRRVGDEVELRCSDDGIGIAPSDRDAVFDMFRRSRDARTRGVPGSGMGLAIAQRIVSRLGGAIELESATGSGTTFTVRLPAS